MKRTVFLFLGTFCFCAIFLTGCEGGGENTVVEAPPAAGEEQPAMEGMTDEEYDKAMDEDMGN